MSDHATRSIRDTERAFPIRLRVKIEPGQPCPQFNEYLRDCLRSRTAIAPNGHALDVHFVDTDAAQAFCREFPGVLDDQTDKLLSSH